MSSQTKSKPLNSKIKPVLYQSGFGRVIRVRNGLNSPSSLGDAGYFCGSVTLILLSPYTIGRGIHVARARPLLSFHRANARPLLSFHRASARDPGQVSGGR